MTFLIGAAAVRTAFRRVKLLLPFSVVALVTLGACAQVSSNGATTGAPIPVDGRLARSAHRNTSSQSPIQHVVIIVQENRSVDDLFQFLPGANTQRYGMLLNGKKIHLKSESLSAPFDLTHTHAAFTGEYNGGGMNGFESEVCSGTCPSDAAFSYVPPSEVRPYYDMAEKYTFADNMFQSNEGPSFPAHQYLISGTSTVSDTSLDKAAENPRGKTGTNLGGCDSPSGTLEAVINPAGQEPPALATFPCFQRQAIMNEMDAAGITWNYYQTRPGPGLWKAVDAISSIWSNKAEMAANVISPQSKVLTDIANDRLAQVVWVTPTSLASDHPKGNNGSGPSWVASIVNAIGASQYWSSTVIFIVWDDWGGFYDHVAPTIYNSYELGFRVPFIVVSPYAKTGYISHVPHEFGSILKFTEETFNLPSLGTTDVRSDDLSDCFDFQRPMTKFKRIHQKYPARYFFTQPLTEVQD